MNDIRGNESVRGSKDSVEDSRDSVPTQAKIAESHGLKGDEDGKQVA